MNNLTHYEPMNILQEFNKLFNEKSKSNRDLSSIDTSHWAPAVDIIEEKNQFVIHTDLPGIDKKDISISMDHNTLNITGERTLEKKEDNESFSRVERSRGTFYRRFVLPDTADGEQIAAQMQKGVLTIIIPKKSTAKFRSIEIHGDD